MISSLKPVVNILNAPNTQLMVPVFQRVYSWNHIQCRQLWKDLVGAGTSGKDHFMSTLIYREEPYLDQDLDAQVLRKFSIVDGQQRLTTITLLIAALRDKLRDSGDTQMSYDLDDKYLHAVPGSEKLILSSDDAATLKYIIDKKQLASDVEPSKFLIDNYHTFADLLSSNDVDVKTVIQGLYRLKVVAVELDENDSPQQVFESLNTKGRPLSTIDLLRNILIKEYGYDEQEKLLNAYWAPIEDAFERFDKEKDLYLDAALHCWLAKSSPGLRASKRSDLYQVFKTYLEHRSASSLETTLASINAECIKFALNPNSSEAKIHIDWAIEKPTGTMSQKKLFGD